MSRYVVKTPTSRRPNAPLIFRLSLVLVFSFPVALLLEWSLR